MDSEPSSPTGSPPDAKRSKLEEMDGKPYHLLNKADFDNALFRQYYKEIIPAEEFDLFMSTLQRELPGTFRVCGSQGEEASVINSRVLSLASKISQHSKTLASMPSTATEAAENRDVEESKPEEVKNSLKPLVWYPGEQAWQHDSSRHSLRKQEDEIFQELRSFLITESFIGHISRQEAVSMIPPLFLQIKEFHKVLDMCAAPGSKTAQLIEMLHRDAPESYNSAPTAPAGTLETTSGAQETLVKHNGGVYITDRSEGYSGIVRGFVHANDANNKRCNTLITQTKRLSSPSLIVTNHDAQALPTIRLKAIPNPSSGQDNAQNNTSEKMIVDGTNSTSNTTNNPNNGTTIFEGEAILYDRILADVPCSGDGTLRKNADLWARWTPIAGHGLHTTQLAILTRAIQLSAPGARIVYSTCSLNPVEDEAVISAAILNCDKKVRLVDVSDQLPLLKRRQGLYTWKEMDPQGNWYSKVEEVPVELQKRYIPSTFPPSLEIAQELHLERCMRFFPHDQDTGGFFVAVLERVEDSGLEIANPKLKKKKYFGGKNLPAAFSKPPASQFDPIWDSIQSFFELPLTFPKDQLFAASKNVTKLYLATNEATRLLDNDSLSKLKLKSLGVRLFEKIAHAQECPCLYRVTQDGVFAIYPFMIGTPRLIEISDQKDLELLLVQKDPMYSDFTEPIGTLLSQLGVGSIVYSYYHTSVVTPNLPKRHILAVAWKGRVSTHLLLKEGDKQSILSSLKW